MPTSLAASQDIDSPKNSPKAKTSRYRPEIDGLRAFAVIAVIINHFNKDILPGGYLGVDIFFVISGYVITSSLSERPSKDFKDFISGFYERRIKRLVPALAVFVLITSIAICLFNPLPETSLKTGLTSLFGLSNIYLLKISTDYFAQSTELNVFTHTWSLGVEEQFYILFPFLIWFSGFGRQTKNGAQNLFLVVGALTITSLIGFLYLYPINQPAAYFLMPSRFWEMAAGCLIFIGFQKRASVEQLLERVPPFLAMALIVVAMYLPMSLAAASTIGVVVLSSILIACLKKQTAAFKVFTNPKLVYIGLISYSLYLWHWGVLSISRWTIGVHWWSVPFQIVLMLGIANASYRWIETPLRKGNWFGKRWKTLVAGGGVLITLSGGLAALARPLQGKLYTGSYEDGIEKAISGENCNILRNFEQAINFKHCGFTSNDGANTLFVLGDSHGHQYTDGIAELAKKNTMNYNVIWGNLCLFPGAVHSIRGKECSDRQKKIESKVVKKSKQGDIVFVANTLTGYFDNYKGQYSTSNGQSLTKDQALREYFASFNEFTKKLNKKGVKVVLYTDGVRFPHLISGMICKREWFRENLHSSCYGSKSEHQNLIAKLFPWTESWENKTNRFVWHASQYQSDCNNTNCSASSYIDDNHFSNSESALILKRFISQSKLIANY